MKRIKKAGIWLWMLTKRLYKKPAFVAIVLLVPLLTFGYQTMVQEDSGMVTVALAQKGEDPVAQQIMEQLHRETELFQFRICGSAREAEELVQTGKVDAAWIFPADMIANMDAFLESPKSHPFITVLQREDNVLHMLARERLTGTLYQQLSQRIYLRYMRQEFPALSHLSDGQLMEYYDSVELDTHLFTYDSVAGEQIQDVHYLMSPVRGLLAIVVVLCSMATAMYYIQDRRRGTFAWVPEGLQPIPELGCQLVAVLHVGLAAFASLMLAGIGKALLPELGVTLLYVLCTVSFCMLLRQLLNSVKTLGILLPVLVVVMLVVCPVFFDLGKLRLLQFLLPPTYYINGVYNSAYVWYMVGYTLINFGLYWVLLWIKNLKRTA